jgi:TolA-binding protein
LPDEARLAYEAGWSALRSGEFDRASESFRTVLDRSTDEGLVEDARYFLGVSLARAGHADRAIDALEHFLAVHPSSSRAAEATAMLGWLRYERGEDGPAAALFERAASSASVRAAKSARDGLEAIRRDRSRTGR